MIECPYCKDLIGETLETCPVCHKQFTKEDLQKISDIRSERIKLLQRERKKLLDEYNRKCIIALKGFYTIIVLMILACVIVSIHPNIVTAIIACATVLALIVWCLIVFNLVLRVTTCPLCGGFVKLGTRNCWHCGERISY